MEQTLEHRIRQRAYEIWHATGCAEGRADEHWLAAERELLAASADLFAAPAATVTHKGSKASKDNRGARRAAKSAKSPAAA